jgi:hypothetical protein
MNVQMRLITSDNINHLLSLHKSNNIKLLTGKETLKEVEIETREKLNASSQNEEEGERMEKYDDDDLFGDYKWKASDEFVAAANKSDKSDKPFEIGDKVLFSNVAEYELSPSTIFEIKWIDDTDVGILNPVTGELIVAYIGELAYAPNAPESQDYTNVSPTYGPVSPTYGPVSPTYGPVSPTYGPVSPTYGPVSPTSESPDPRQNVTITETKTITGPPNLVLPAQDTGFRSYQVQPITEEPVPEVGISTTNPSSKGERRYDGKKSFTKEEFISHYGTGEGMRHWENAKNILVVPEDTRIRNDYDYETLQEAWKQKIDEKEPEISYTRDKESPEKLNEVIRTSIKTAQESNTTPLLATIEAEATKEDEGVVSGIKSVNTE